MAKKAKWTVMVLMGANNISKQEKDLSKQAEDDLTEMETVGSQPGALSIVVQVDQKKDDKNPDGGPKRYFIAKNKRQDLGPIPAGRPGSGNQLEQFLRWAKKDYPADHYLLVLWGHAYDLAFNRNPDDPEGLDFPQLSEALRKTNSGNKLDIVGFDSCNTAFIEGAYQLRDTASYLVASQFSDPLPGWPYDKILNRVLNDRNYQNGNTPSYFADPNGPKDFGRVIVSQFVRNYRGERSAAMTMLDLSQTANIQDPIMQLADELTLAIQSDDAEFDLVCEIFARCQVPSVTAAGQPSVDLIALCWNLTTFSGSEDVRLAAAAVGEALLMPNGVADAASDTDNSFIVANARNDLGVAMLNGVSIYAPNVVSETEPDRKRLRKRYTQLEFVGRKNSWASLVFALAENQ